MDDSIHLSWSSYSGMDGLETDSCDTVLQWTRLQGTRMLFEGSCDSVARRMIFRNVDVTLPLTIRLLTIRASSGSVHNDTCVSIWTGIASKLHCSAVSLVPMPLVSNIPASSYNTYRYTPPLSPYTTYPPPSYYSYFFFFFSSFILLFLQTFATIRLLRLRYSYQAYLLLDILHTSYS